MANLSDAFGTITVEKVGHDFLEFLNAVQGKESDAYYTLVEEDCLDVVPDADGDVEFEFSTFGRWSYSNNIEGYLKVGNWMQKDEDKVSYEKLLNALKQKSGSIEIAYTDSDPAMGWMEKGVFTMSGVNGEVEFKEVFDQEEVNIVKYAEMNKFSVAEAIEFLHGDDAALAYDNYLKQCKEDGKEPSSADDWYDNEYEEEI